MSFWHLFKKSLYEELENRNLKNKNNVGNNTGTGTGTNIDVNSWRLIYEKFRDVKGRDPNTILELQRWWKRY